MMKQRIVEEIKNCSNDQSKKISNYCIREEEKNNNKLIKYFLFSLDSLLPASR